MDRDKEISDQILLKEWYRLLDNLPALSKLKIWRNIFEPKTKTRIEYQGFTDFSSLAFAACVWIRTEYEDELVSCYLVSSKTLVTSLEGCIYS